MAGPNALSIRMYHVGFGDCFLLTFHYSSVDRHLLLDFGSTRTGKVYMTEVANDIRLQTNGKLDAVLVTHRHKDHLSGFAKHDDPSKSSGDVIASLNPELVSLTWTEDPELAEDAAAPSDNINLAFINSLASMENLARRLEILAQEAKKKRRFGFSSEAEVLADINIPNKPALQTLLSLTGQDDTEFLHYKSRTKLNRMFRGVKFHILGPPTVEQSSRVKRQRARDNEEYWHIADYWRIMDNSFAAIGDAAEIPFAKKHIRKRKPPYANWFVERMQHVQSNDLLQISRVMDNAINNSSIILLIEVGGKKLLFPGDAQIESWDFVLNGPDKEKNRALLADVDLYKVGHHGSLNGTPKTLWKLFEKRKDHAGTKNLVSLLSSRIDIHGKKNRGTEVPRAKLVDALKTGSRLIATPWDISKLKKFREVDSELHRIEFDE